MYRSIHFGTPKSSRNLISAIHYELLEITKDLTVVFDIYEIYVCFDLYSIIFVLVVTYSDNKKIRMIETCHIFLHRENNIIRDTSFSYRI